MEALCSGLPLGLPADERHFAIGLPAEGSPARRATLFHLLKWLSQLEQVPYAAA